MLSHSMIAKRSHQFDKTRAMNQCIERYHTRNMAVLEKQRRISMMTLMRETSKLKIELRDQKLAKVSPPISQTIIGERSKSRLSCYSARSRQRSDSVNGVVPQDITPVNTYGTFCKRDSTVSFNEENAAGNGVSNENRNGFFLTAAGEVQDNGHIDTNNNSVEMESIFANSDDKNHNAIRTGKVIKKMKMPKQIDTQKYVEETIRKLQRKHPKLAASYQLSMPTDDATMLLAQRRYSRRKQSLKQRGKVDKEKTPNTSNGNPSVPSWAQNTESGEASWNKKEPVPEPLQVGGREAYRLPSLISVSEEQESKVGRRFNRIRRSMKSRKLKGSEFDTLMMMSRIKQTKDNVEIMQKVGDFLVKDEYSGSGNHYGSDYSSSDGDDLEKWRIWPENLNNL